jgi:hypothetical protein
MEQLFFRSRLKSRLNRSDLVGFLIGNKTEESYNCDGNHERFFCFNPKTRVILEITADYRQAQ